MAVDDSYTKILLHFDGIDASTAFTDESGKVWTAAGSAQIDTAESKFNGASGLFAVATSDYISSPDNADFYPGSDDFTVELWYKKSSISSSVQFFCTQRGSTGQASDDCFALTLDTSQLPYFTIIGVSGTIYQIAGAASDTTTTDAWHHLAGVKYGGNMYLYQDGIQLNTAAIAEAALNSTQAFVIGGQSNSTTTRSFQGWIDEFRYSKGIARYTAAFTPPVSPFYPPSGESVYFADGFGIY
jgi:hypothetical protein